MHHLSDLIVRIKNATLAEKESFSILHCNINENVLAVLKEYGYIKDFKKYKEGKFKYINIEIFSDDGSITDIKAVSKPGRRVYANVLDLKKRKSRLGMYVVSTPKGVLSDKKAISQNIGGEILLRVW